MKIQCAIYVRKSSDRGLDMEFNSLDNQELACKSYIASQAFQGWEYFKTYSDAAISGGTMARPGLQQMLDDVRAGKIHCVLVYKIDRLSRSIYDFKRMMKEIFERYDCNLVSITQSFDTSTAMGKLTLNMLLSFAEFEREVASERVRDKMRATKSKGLWVGGIPPLGYDIQFGKLVVNEAERETVNKIFNTYLDSNSLLDCRDQITALGIRGKQWTSKKGEIHGGREMTANIVERILKNQIYLGKLPNKSTGEVFDGQHPAIITKELFDTVQQKLQDNNNHKGRTVYCRGRTLFHNMIYTADGMAFKNKTGNKGLRQYKYYKCGKISLPAGDFDTIVCNNVRDFLNSDMGKLPDTARLTLKQLEYSEALAQAMIDRIVYNDHKLTIFINITDLDKLSDFRKDSYINTSATPMDYCLSPDGAQVIIEQVVYLSSHTCINHRNAGCSRDLLTKTENATMLIKALAYAWKYKKAYESGIGVKAIATTEKRDQRTIYKYLNLAYLSPRIINDIMDSKIPPHINLQILFQIASKYEDFAEQEREFYN
ncbi:MAG: recombinase family protein [Muribaculaceae bacterium]|nr:recombinase family protein [Muribaculaceae bacterium]